MEGKNLLASCMAKINISNVGRFSSSRRDIKGTFHVRMGLIKDRNVKNLTEAEKIKKR